VGVATLTIIKYLNVLKDTGLCGVATAIVFMVNQFCLQAMEEAFGNRIVPALALKASVITT
jgi:hypothetical protein